MAAKKNLKLASTTADRIVMKLKTALQESRAFAAWIKKQIPEPKGQFAVVCADIVMGPFPSYQIAREQGFGRFPDRQIYIIQIGAPAPADHQVL